MDQFEAYFRRADLDGDGRISGAEAVSFFQGSNLPKQVLAQVRLPSYLELLFMNFSHWIRIVDSYSLYIYVPQEVQGRI